MIMRFACTILMGAALTVSAAAEEYTTNAGGLDRRNFDFSTAACEDFYQFANGGWLERNPIPEDQSRWTITSEMRTRNYELLREILEEAVTADAEVGSNKRKVADFWSTAMDTEAIEEAGQKPLAGDLERIGSLGSMADLQAFLRDMHAEGTTLLFDIDVDQDLKNSTQYIVYATQGGLGLPDRDYYLRKDEESEALRTKYVAHVGRMLRLLGDEPAEAESAAKAILALETALAEASLTRVELRDPQSYYNIMTVAEADEATPAFDWAVYFDRLGLGDLESFSYAHPKFFAAMNEALGDVPLDTWKSYLRWHTVNAFSPYLNEELVAADFDFYGTELRGTPSQRPRWKRVVDQTSQSMGEALGQVYVERAFPPDTKQRADEMIGNLRATVKSRLEGLDWMSDETKARALEKLAAFSSKIGYPGEWRDYSNLQVGTDSYLANVRSAAAFELRRNLDKIGQPIDRNEWSMAPQTVNAYYNPVMNEIVFPAAIMQPPFFDGEIDDPVNYGGMGAVIGHELMHGFDDKGSQFDAEGNMANWWTDEDRRLFEERTRKLVAQYGDFVAVDDLHVNGKLTLGENIGDLAGLTMAYHALRAALEKDDPGVIDGFTPEQRFFLSWAQVWRGNYRPEGLKLQVNTDPHSPAKFRVLGPLSNMPEFAEAFGCKDESPMVRPAADRADIW